ncbi:MULTISPECIES: WXG100 family type VII secretion target [Mycobacteriaceae]|uniref:ESAT-6-like protein n=1 Tax=Mycolicibacterium peregrinum TaxID=43304 RepID=A0A1A0WBL3_MYCPR|nr:MULTISPECIES: WXG100 family type VII secretion target [Mycobacteriaceae]MCA2243367.1 WXG100 family type VII secretion target [Mycobacterium sp. WUMAC-067]OBB94756.1 peptidase M22 [Mycolicibacterium peregrinum]
MSTVANFLSDPAAMRDYAGRFHGNSQTIDAESKKAWASATGIAGAGWTGNANTTSTGTLEEMMRAFRNIVDMTQGVSDKLNRSADEYEQREHESTQILSS